MEAMVQAPSYLSSATLWGFAGKGSHPKEQQGTVATRRGRVSGHKQWLYVLYVWRGPGRHTVHRHMCTKCVYDWEMAGSVLCFLSQHEDLHLNP